MASNQDRSNDAGPSEEEEDDDYMNMTFDDPAPAKETSFQRTQRLKKESRARGVIKSKAELAEEEAAAREEALSKSLLEDPRAKKSKGLAMMAKMGFAGGGLGKKNEDGKGLGRAEPIKVDVKEDRGGIGLDSEKKRKLREAAEERGIKSVKLDPDEYRERVRKDREDARLEKQLHAAQRMAERLDEEKSTGSSPGEGSDPTIEEEGKKKKTDGSIDSRPLKSFSILYRGLIRHRAEVERDRRMRHDLEQSLTRLPTYDDDDEDEDDKRALGKTQTVYAVADDLDEEDEELEAFNNLELGERLRRLLEYLRTKHWYCFWCKTAYTDDEMDGCPGLTEEDHD
jgi:hypothetical protein